MTRIPSTRVILLPDVAPTAAASRNDKIRRYRLARVRLVERNAAGDPRHPQLGRSYD